MFTAQFLEKVHLQNFRCFCAWLVTVVIFGFGVWLVSFFFFSRHDLADVRVIGVPALLLVSLRTQSP